MRVINKAINEYFIKFDKIEDKFKMKLFETYLNDF